MVSQNNSPENTPVILFLEIWHTCVAANDESFYVKSPPLKRYDKSNFLESLHKIWIGIREDRTKINTSVIASVKIFGNASTFERERVLPGSCILGTRLDLLVGQHLRWNILGCTYKRVFSIFLLQFCIQILIAVGIVFDPCRTKVCHLDVHVFIQKNVFRLQVPEN